MVGGSRVEGTWAEGTWVEGSRVEGTGSRGVGGGNAHAGGCSFEWAWACACARALALALAAHLAEKVEGAAAQLQMIGGMAVYPQRPKVVKVHHRISLGVQREYGHVVQRHFHAGGDAAGAEEQREFKLAAVGSIERGERVVPSTHG